MRAFRWTLAETTWATERAVGITESYEFRLGAAPFHIAADDGEVAVKAGPAPSPAMVYTADLGIALAMYTGQISPEETVTEGGAHIEGSAEAAARAWAILDIHTSPEPTEPEGA